jgi:hypothetical protein
MRRSTFTSVKKLLRQRPLPLGELVAAIQRDPALASFVLRAASGERSMLPPPDLESSILLLGAEGVRGALERAARSRRRRPKPKGASAGRPPHPDQKKLRGLQKALAVDRYRVDPRSIAAAMMRELERS